MNVSKSVEGAWALRNQRTAEDDDGDDCEDTVAGCPAQDAIFACQTNAEAASGQFSTDGTAACYKGTTFTFNMEVAADASGNVSPNAIMINEEQNGYMTEIGFKTAKMISGNLVIEFAEEKIYNASESDLSVEGSNSFTVQSSCEGSGTTNPEYLSLIHI